MNFAAPIIPAPEFWTGDALACLELVASNSIDCVVTSPPYWNLRDYGVVGQIGLEPTMAEYLATMVAVCRELRRVLKPSGTFWLVIGDCYSGLWGAQSRGHETPGTLGGGSMLLARQIKEHPRTTRTGSADRTGLKAKDLCMIPNRLAILLQDDGWWVRSEIVWSKPNPMPESVTDRPTNCHEKIWLLTKSAKYHYDAAAIRNPPSEAFLREVVDGYTGSATKDSNRSGLSDVERALGSNCRNVWTISPKPFKGAHFATFPPDLVERCILAGCPPGGLVLDSFSGSGTTAMVAARLGRRSLNFEINPDYVALARERVAAARPLQSL